MYGTTNGAERARWEVLWIVKGRVVRRDCGDDFLEAVRIRDLAVEGGRRAVTLRCKNFGFPPPVELRPQKVMAKFKLDPPRIVTRNGKKYKQHTETRPALLVPMKKKNAEGIFWCAYCMKLRRFVERKGFKVDGIWISERTFCCPMCGVSVRDHNIKKWNPKALAIFYEMESKPRRAAPRTTKTRRAARQRRRRRAT